MGKFQLTSSGEVSIYAINSTGQSKILTRSNLTLPMLKDVIARLMGNFPIGKIDKVVAMVAGGVLAEAPITKWEHPESNAVQFSAIFSNESFSGAYDELGLVASNMGKIAKLTGISESKPNTDKLLITWKITIK